MDLMSTFLNQIITFFALLDPFGISAVALSLFGNNITQEQLIKNVRKTILTVFIAFFVVLLTGDILLKIFGIDENSLKAMGGVILFLMAVSMVNGTMENTVKSFANKDVSVIPLAIPIAFGTGTLTTIIIFKNQAASLAELILLSIAFCVNILVLYLALRYSFYVKKYLKELGQNIITKLMGLIVGAMAIQFIVCGIVGLVKKYF